MGRKQYVVKVSSETYELLRKLKEKHDFSYNDLIAIGLSYLEGVEDLTIKSNIREVRVNVGKTNVNYKFIGELFGRGYDVFIPEISERQASYIKRMIHKRVGCKCKMLFVEVGERRGYLFMGVKED